MLAARKTKGPGDRCSMRETRSSTKVEKVMGPVVVGVDQWLWPKPRRSGAIRVKLEERREGRRGSNMREDMGQPWRRIRVRGEEEEEAV